MFDHIVAFICIEAVSFFLLSRQSQVIVHLKKSDCQKIFFPRRNNG